MLPLLTNCGVDIIMLRMLLLYSFYEAHSLLDSHYRTGCDFGFCSMVLEDEQKTLTGQLTTRVGRIYLMASITLFLGNSIIFKPSSKSNDTN